MTAAELAAIVEAHGKWRRSEPGGIRANLAGANLTRADLAGANLSDANLARANLADANLARANLTRANLSDANLAGANLTRADLAGAYLAGAYLAGAYLTGADLAGANLTRIRDDVSLVLDGAPAEVPGLLAALRAGKVDGSTYSGSCACLVGTLANVRGCEYTDLGIRPDSNRPAERWFLAIDSGDTPETNPISKITEGWIVDWLAAHPAQAAHAEAKS